MRGAVIINGYPKGEKFIRQGERIKEELCRLGVPTQVYRAGEVYALVNEAGEVEHTLPADCRFAVYLDKDKYLGGLLEKSIRLFNPAKSVELCDDKMQTYCALLGGGVRLVDSIPAPLCYTRGAEPDEKFLKSVGERLGFPLVAKKSYGSFGEGVQLVPGYSQLVALEKEWQFTPHFYQRYIREANGRDFRVIVIGKRAIACMERVAKAGEFRSNIELGGEGRKADLTPALKEVAERAATALGLDYCGVDLLQTEKGVAVCEVNSNAFFEGIEGATGINVPRAYAEYIVEELRKSS